MAYIVKVGSAISTVIAPTASQVSIVDAGGYYTSDDVEGALQEVGATDASQQISIDANTANVATNTSNISTNTSAIAGKVDTAGRALNKSGTTLNVDANFTSTQYDTSFQALTIGSGNLVSWDANSGQAATLTVDSDCTISNPTNVSSFNLVLEVIQDATGGHTVSFDTDFVVYTDSVLTSANSITVYYFVKCSDGSLRGQGNTFLS